MAIYRVFERPGRSANEAVFIREGFSWAAAIFLVFWALWNRMWIVAAVLLACFAAVSVLGGYIAAGDDNLTIINAAIGLILGLEAEHLRGWSLRRAGYRETGLVQGNGIDEAELKFFMDRPAETVLAGAVAPKLRHAHAPDTLGLFGTT